MAPLGREADAMNVRRLALVGARCAVVGAMVSSTVVFSAAPTTAIAPITAADGNTLAPFCARVAVGVSAGEIQVPDLVELSGLAASHAHPGVLWAHNDSGDSARLFAISVTGAPLGTFDITGAGATDWEDIAVGPGPEPGQAYIYIGDIGDNNAQRDHVTVYRVPEPGAAPNGTNGALTGALALNLRYPTGPEDAESLFVDPANGDLYIITKVLSGASRVLVVSAADLSSTATVTMTQVATLQIADTGAFDPTAKLALPAALATAADISPDGSTILVRTYQQVLAYRRADGESIADALAGTPCSAPQVAEPQGEAIAFSAAGDAYFTSGETQLAVRLGDEPAGTEPRLAEFTIAAPAVDTTTTEPVTTPEPATTEPATSAPVTAVAAPIGSSPATDPQPTVTPTRPSSSSASSSSGSSWIWVLVVALAIGLGAVAAVRARNRRTTSPPEPPVSRR